MAEDKESLGAMARTKLPTKKLPCSCTHAYQQEKYGSNRIHNPTQKGWRCTVCGNLKPM